MSGEMKKLKSLVIMISCVILTGAIFPGKLFAETVIEEWVATYNGPGNDNDWADAITVDASGNVYVTGQSGDTTTNNDYATVKYDSSGNQVWIARYDGPENENDYAGSIAVDASGNVYVTGRSYSSDTHYDYATVKYDPNGSELWVARYNGPGDGHDNTSAITVDAEGNVYVTGFCYSGDNVNFDYATVKYDSSGNQLWVARYDGPANMQDYASSMALDSEGNVYVTGRSRSSESNIDYATVKYDTNGNELWVARYDPSGYASDEACAIAVDPEGNVYVTGHSWNLSTNLDYATIKYDINGNQLWVARYDGPGNGYDWAYAMALDASGNVYVAGGSYSSDTSFDYATVKYDSSGNELWIARYDGPASHYDEAMAMALDASGDVYVTGYSDGGTTFNDYATVKYDSSGNELWVARYNGPGNGFDYAVAMALDASGNVYVTGQSYGSTNDDYATIKYASFEDPAKAIEELIAQVISLNLENGVTNSLDGKLGAALNALDDVNTNNDVAAINTLEAFINKVELQRGEEIPNEADANALISAAQEIIAVLSGP
jgi:uncharacterized delta-60 repeat protein